MFNNWHIHVSYIVLAAVLALGGYVGVHSWIEEHDARLIAEQKVAVDEQQVKTLQDSIAANNAAIATLQTQMQQRDAQNAQVIQTLLKQKAAATTPVQQVAVLQTTAKLPEPITSLPNTTDWRLPSADVAPLFGAVEDGAVATANLTTCQSDLADEKSVEVKDQSTIADQQGQIKLKDNEIAVLKKPKGFWSRVKTTFKEIGIGFGIGVAVGHHF